MRGIVGLLTGVSLIALAGSASAEEIFFGAFPQPAGCTTTAGDEGAVCPNNLTFAGDISGVLTVRGFLGNPNTSPDSFLTFKGPPNPLDEQGIGQNDFGPGNPCNTTDCEIGGGASVSVTAQVPLTEFDVVVSSVQNLEAFNVWAGDAPGSLTEVASGLNATNCNLLPGRNDVCVFVLGTPATTIAVQSDNQFVEAADVLLEAVSNTVVPVPEPSTLSILGAGLFGLGALFRLTRKSRSGKGWGSPALT